MRYCPNCGSKLTEETKFCPTCGTEQNTQQSVRRTAVARKRLHCPNCRSTSLTPIVESMSSFGSVGRISKKVAITETSTSNKSYWMCQECGHKFRNLEDLIQENKKLIFFINFVLYGAFAFLSIFSILMGLLTNQLGTTLVQLIIFAVAILFCRAIVRKVKNNMTRKEKQLRKDCFE